MVEVLWRNEASNWQEERAGLCRIIREGKTCWGDPICAETWKKCKGGGVGRGTFHAEGTAWAKTLGQDCACQKPGWLQLGRRVMRSEKQWETRESGAWWPPCMLYLLFIVRWKDIDSLWGVTWSDLCFKRISLDSLWKIDGGQQGWRSVGKLLHNLEERWW